MKAWHRWVNALSVTEVGWGLALFRIAMSVTVLWTLGGVLHADLVDILWLDQADGGIRKLGSGSWLVRSIGLGITPGVVHQLLVVALVGASAMLLGLGGRVAVLVTQQSFMALVDINSYAGGSYDELMINAMWLLFLGNSTATLSLDARLRTGQWAPKTRVSAWPRYLAVYQLMLMYWTTGLQKVSAYWTPGGDLSALYYILQQPTWQRIDMTWLAWMFPITQVGTFLSWTWEVTAPLWLFAFLLSIRPDNLTSRWRRWTQRFRIRIGYAVLGVIFHSVVFITMEVGPFSPACLAYYFCLVHDREYDLIGQHLRRAWRSASVNRTRPARCSTR